MDSPPLLFLEGRRIEANHAAQGAARVADVAGSATDLTTCTPKSSARLLLIGVALLSGLVLIAWLAARPVAEWRPVEREPTGGF